MSLVQVLNHLHTMHLGLILSQVGIDSQELSTWSTPVFATKLQFVKKIFLEQPSLYAEILVHNPHLEQICDLYQETFKDLEKTVRQRDADKIAALIKSSSERLWLKRIKE